MARQRNDGPEGSDNVKQDFVTFYKARNQASVIWDPSKDRAFVEFDKNMTFTTKDPEKIKKLKELGYKTEPPAIKAGEVSGFVPTEAIGGVEQDDREEGDQEI